MTIMDALGKTYFDLDSQAITALWSDWLQTSIEQEMDLELGNVFGFFCLDISYYGAME